jgi:hypothetical protein
MSAPAARWTRVYLALYSGYVALGMLMRWNGWLHVDHIWFVDAARHILDGSWRLYEFRPALSAGIAPPDGLAYSYSPLTALLMAPFVALADALGRAGFGVGVGGADGVAYRLIALPLLIADALAMDQLRRLARAWRPQVDETPLFLGILLTLFYTGFLQVSAFRDHQEGLVLLFVLLTLRVTPRRPLLGGICAGLALAAKQTSVLDLAPIGLVLLGAGVLGQAPRGWRALGPVGRWTGAAAGVFGLFMLPPWLADRDAVVYAFFTQEQRRVISGQGAPAWIDMALRGALGADAPAYALWHDRLLRFSNPALIVVALALMIGALWWNARRGRPVGLVDDRLLALVALGAALQIVLAKWVTGHYYQLPLALVLVWDAVRTAPRWPWIGLAAAAGFRSLAAAVDLPATPWVKDAVLFLLFAGLVALALRGALGPPAESGPAGVRAPRAAPA